MEAEKNVLTKTRKIYICFVIREGELIPTVTSHECVAIRRMLRYARAANLPTLCAFEGRVMSFLAPHFPTQKYSQRGHDIQATTTRIQTFQSLI